MAGDNSSVRYRSLDFFGFPGYRVGDDGTVWSCRPKNGKGANVSWRQLRPTPRPNGGYLVAVLHPGQHTFLVHRLIMEAFVGPRPDGLQCCHGDGNPANNAISNLRW